MAESLLSAASRAGVKSLDNLTEEEISHICKQFSSKSWLYNKQVLWTGLLCDNVQKWAKDNGMQTFIMAMGPLMTPGHPLCVKESKKSQGKKAWSNYIHGASAIFAWYISQGTKVTVLLRPPPKNFHPSGKTSYQLNEQPLLKLRNTGFRIYAVHPEIKGPGSNGYPIWPPEDDQTKRWMKEYGEYEERPWRLVRGYRPIINPVSTGSMSLPCGDGCRGDGPITAKTRTMGDDQKYKKLEEKSNRRKSDQHLADSEAKPKQQGKGKEKIGKTEKPVKLAIAQANTQGTRKKCKNLAGDKKKKAVPPPQVDSRGKQTAKLEFSYNPQKNGKETWMKRKDGSPNSQVVAEASKTKKKTKKKTCGASRNR